MKYTIISTYPEEGSKNIGDGLITISTKNAIKHTKGDDNTIQVVWKQSKWEDVKEKIIGSDALIFACLALRERMDVIDYPYFEQLLDLKIPMGVISAGTSLRMNEGTNKFFSHFSSNVVEELKELNQKALFFTTRGYLSQSFCKNLGLDKTTHSGDIAFFDPRFSERKFVETRTIKKIAISDPHYAKFYLSSIELLTSLLQKTFPDAELSFVLHGVNPRMEKFCEDNKFHIEKIYLDKERGLDIYDSFDLHVGYRVHAHVSTLSRRKPSYLLEQDGRGCDYGLTIEKKITVPNFFSEKIDLNAKNAIKKILGRKLIPSKVVTLDPVFQIIAMIDEDSQNGFKKFLGLEKQILGFNKLCLEAIAKLP